MDSYGRGEMVKCSLLLKGRKFYIQEAMEHPKSHPHAKTPYTDTTGSVSPSPSKSHCLVHPRPKPCSQCPPWRRSSHPLSGHFPALLQFWATPLRVGGNPSPHRPRQTAQDNPWELLPHDLFRYNQILRRTFEHPNWQNAAEDQPPPPFLSLMLPLHSSVPFPSSTAFHLSP